MEDIYDIKEKDKAKIVTEEFEIYWEKHKNSRYSLIFSITRYIWDRFLISQFLKLISDVCILIQVFFF
jgi:hypothetical protein